MKTEIIVALAKEVEVEDPIDWGMLNINEDDAYKLVATSVIEEFSLPWSEDMQTAILATITKLVVENFVLNLKLISSNK